MSASIYWLDSTCFWKFLTLCLKDPTFLLCAVHTTEKPLLKLLVYLLVKKGRSSFCLWSVQSLLRVSSWLAVTLAGALMLELADGSALTEMKWSGFWGRSCMACRLPWNLAVCKINGMYRLHQYARLYIDVGVGYGVVYLELVTLGGGESEIGQEALAILQWSEGWELDKSVTL